MNEPSNVHTLILSPQEEKRLDDIFSHFSKTENNALKFNEFLMLLLDRSMLTNKFGFKFYFDLYNKALEADIKPSAGATISSQIRSIGQTSTSSNFMNKDLKQDKTSLSRMKFNYFISLLADKMFPAEKNRVEKVFTELLTEKAVATNQGVEATRCMMFDDTNKKMMNYVFIKTLLEFEDELRRAFALYYSENLLYNRLLLEWSELALHNKKMNSFGLIKFLREAEILPHLLSIEHFEDLMIKILPPVSPKEHQFYSSSALVSFSSSSSSSAPPPPPQDGDPSLFYHEFQLILCRLAIDTFPKDLVSPSMPVEQPLIKLLEEVVEVRRKREEGEGRKEEGGRREEKPFGKRMKESYEEGKKVDEDKHGDLELVKKELSLEEEIQESKRLLLQYAVKNQFQEAIIPIDFTSVFKMLDRELSALPNPHPIVQENPPPFLQTPVVIGEQPPKPLADKKKIQPKPPKKTQLKKGEKPPRPVIWSDPPPARAQTSHERMVEFKAEREFGESGRIDLKKPTVSEIEVSPCLLKEIIYPVEVPNKNVLVLIEAGIAAHNSSNYAFSLENFEKAKHIWASFLKKDLPDQLLLFFEFSSGQVLESAGRDDLALNRFLECKTLGEKLEFNNPDRALGLSGVGSVLFHMEEFELAARCFMKVREIREIMLGGDTIDTASAYNNLGCCMFFLDRVREAMAYFKLAKAILEAELGTYHFRTTTAARNLEKTKRRQMEYIPEFKRMWIMYEKDPFKKIKGKKKKKK